jgi:hypothetical protein
MSHIRIIKLNKPRKYKIISRKNNLTKLPKDILNKIVSYFDVYTRLMLASTNKRLREHIHTIPLSLFNEEIFLSKINLYLQNNPDLNLYSARFIISNRDFSVLNPFIPRLLTLKLSVLSGEDILLSNINLTNNILRELEFSFNTTAIQKLSLCSSLTQLTLSNNSTITNISPIVWCNNLQKLEISFCQSLENLDVIQNMLSLKEIEVNKCVNVAAIPSFIGCISLRSIIFKYCTVLTNFICLDNCVPLQYFSAIGCYNLNNLDGLSRCKTLLKCHIDDNVALKDIIFLRECSFLVNVTLEQF